MADKDLFAMNSSGCPPMQASGRELTLQDKADAITLSVDQRIEALTSIVEKQYCARLDGLPIKPIAAESYDVIARAVWLYRVRMLSYDKENEGASQKLEAVLSAINMCGGTFLMAAEVGTDGVSLLMGVTSRDSRFGIDTLREVLRDSLRGNFQGIQLEDIGEDMQRTRENLEARFRSNYANQCVTAISNVAHCEEGVLPGLDTILNATADQIYTILLVAEPVSQAEQLRIRDSYEKLSTQISQLTNIALSKQVTHSITQDHHISLGISTGIQKGYSLMQSEGRTEDVTPRKEKDAVDYLLQTGDILSAAGGSLQLAYAMRMLQDQYHMDDEPEHRINVSQQNQQSINESISNGTNEQSTQGQSLANSQGETMQFNLVNRGAKRLYDSIERYLQWMDEARMQGMMNVSTYIMSPSQALNINIASRYNALLCGSGGHLYGVNSWSGEQADHIKAYLQSGLHPVLVHPEFGEVTPAVMMSARELTRHVALPRENLQDLIVGTHAVFGRRVLSKPGTPASEKILLGNIFHMGVDQEGTPVELSLNDIVSHVLVGGEAGIGKTTAACSILARLKEKGIPFLVVEPAKGEYKGMLSGLEGVKVYSPMPLEQNTDALKLNLFWFREGVNPNEHIEKLKEISCACWPMYAAMPQVLSTALCNAYRKCGWNLKTRKNPWGRIFPSLSDVCEEVRLVIQDKDFSAEVKGNYIGSLLSRLESLGEGMLQEVFSGGNLEDEALFEQCVVLDLSRPDVSEFQSLIMGTVIMRMFEYCTSSCPLLENRTLKHITVLEEAHNLLGKVKATSEGADMREKSVDMLTRCITELGGFGRGFMICDQSPSVLNDNVLKNTNTKLLFNLQSPSDYVTCGSAIGLSDEQSAEIHDLGKGVCVVRQTSWETPVLCHVKRVHFHSKPYQASYDPMDGISQFFACLLKAYCVIGGDKPAVTDQERERAAAWAINANYPIKTRKALLEAVAGKQPWKCCKEIVLALVDKDALFNLAGDREDMDAWTDRMLNMICEEYTEDPLIAMTIIEALLSGENSTDYRDRWFDHTSLRRKMTFYPGKKTNDTHQSASGV